MFKDAALLSDLGDSPCREFFFVGPGVGEAAELAPCAAWGVGDQGGATWPEARVAFRVPWVGVGLVVVGGI